MPRKATPARRRKLMILLAEGQAQGKTQAAIAREHGLKQGVFAGLVADPEYQAILDGLIKDRRSRVLMQMEVMSALALKAHVDIMQDPAHRDRLAAAESILDRTGMSKTSKVQQTTVAAVGVTPVTADFQGRSLADLEHYATHGRFPGE